MKVLSVIDTLEVGGAEVSLLEIYRRFQETEVAICQLYPGTALRSSYEDAGIRILPLDLRGKYAFPSAIRRLEKVVQRERPDLLLATLFRAGIAARWVARRSGLPLVDSFVNDSYSRFRWRELNATGKLKLKAIQTLDRATARWPTWFTSVSVAVRDSNCRALGIPRERVTVIHRGRDPAAFPPVDDSQRTAVRRSLGVDAEQPVLLSVARLLPRKGQRELLQAMVQVCARRPNTRLLLAGEGEDRPVLESQVRSLGLTGHVRLLGNREDVAQLLGAADVFVFPSHYEGHGGALVEAMMAGRPIVATDTSIHRESVAQGDTALLVPVQDPAALAQAVGELLDQPDRARRLGERAREVALERFPIDRIARRHEALYRKVAQGQVPREHARRAPPRDIHRDSHRDAHRDGDSRP